MKYPKLFSPCKIGKVEIKNRIVMAPHSLFLGDIHEDRPPTIGERYLKYYETRAAGGVGLIISEIPCLDVKTGLTNPHKIRIDTDDAIPGFRVLADTVHKYGTKLFVQLQHPGHDAYPPNVVPPNVISASPIASKQHPCEVREMTIEDIKWLSDLFGKAAHRMQTAGVDGISIHAGHHYLIHQFLSPMTNFRKDEYGGCLENRARFLKDIVAAIRRYCGPDFPIMARISVEEYIGKHGYHMDEGVKLATMLEEWGVDCIDASAGGGRSKGSHAIEPPSFDQGWRNHLIRAVKESVKIPVSAVSVIREPAYAEWMLDNGYVDFVESARDFIADPEWANKAREGIDEDIMHCISCERCFVLLGRTKDGPTAPWGHIGCSVNPKCGFETEVPELAVNGGGRRVVVLGAGPAGMEAASILGQRGFSVTLFEKNDYLGGQVFLASQAGHKHKHKWFIETMGRWLLQSGVKVIKGYAPSIEDIKEIDPYAVIDATGAVPLLPDFIEGSRTSPLVLTPPQILRGDVDLSGKSIIIIGSGFTALETAEILSERRKGNGVTVVEMAPYIAPGGIPSVRNDDVAVLELNQVVFMLNRKCTKVDDKGVYLENTKTGEQYYLPCDAVVISIGVTPTNAYGDQLQESFRNVYRIGDAEKPAMIMEAMRAALNTALALE